MEIKDEMTSIDAGWVLTVLAAQFLLVGAEVVGGKDLLRCVLVRTEVRGCMAGLGRAVWSMTRDLCGASNLCKGGTKSLVCL